MLRSSAGRRRSGAIGETIADSTDGVETTGGMDIGGETEDVSSDNSDRASGPSTLDAGGDWL